MKTIEFAKDYLKEALSNHQLSPVKPHTYLYSLGLGRRILMGKSSFKGCFLCYNGGMKTPKCKICGGPHYAYMCFQNPKRKQALRRKYSRFKQGLTPKRDKILSKQTTDKKRLIVELDKYCSLYVRLKASDKFGMASCYCCGKRLPAKMMHNCHFKSRQYLGTRFDLDNMKIGCEECNVILHGNLAKYKEHLLKEIGEERVNDLERKKLLEPTTPELEELLKEMKQKYKALVEERKNGKLN